jgi:hypothetical protein
MVRILEALPDRLEVYSEATCGYGHYHDRLRPIAARLTVAHRDDTVLNGSDRMTSPGAPPSRLTPTG